MFYDITKRIIDIVSSLILLVLFSPIMLLTAIAIKLDSEGPVFADIPDRVGKDGKMFRFYKFRSMIPHAHELLHTDPRLKKLLETYHKNNYKLKEDPRITRVGAFIRKHSIDEFPQLINVLVGNMSLVGPRPYYDFEIREQSEKYPESKRLIRIMQTAKPGITGEWQVSGRSEVDFDKRIEMDAKYAERKSIFYDILIMLKTPLVILIGKGAY